MVKGGQQAYPLRPAPRLYLVAPCLEQPTRLVEVLDGSLEAADVAAVLLQLPETSEEALVTYVRAIAPVVQGRDIALLLHGHPEIVAQAGADGAHLTGIEAFTAAAPMLKPERIAGAGGLSTRHDAMLTGERGADYLMFGEPSPRRDALDAIVERVAWWSELFELPCVAWAEDLDELAALADAGADFVALGEFVFSDFRRTPTMIRAAAERLPAREAVK